MATRKLSLQALATQAVNEPHPMAHTWANAPLLTIAIATNVWAAAVIRGKERTGISTAIIFDCGVNILSMLLHKIARSPWLVPGQPYAVCSAHRVLLENHSSCGYRPLSILGGLSRGSMPQLWDKAGMESGDGRCHLCQSVCLSALHGLQGGQQDLPPLSGQEGDIRICGDV